MIRTSAAKIISEFIGTFALVFAGCGAIMASHQGQISGAIAVPLTFGLIVMVMIYALGHISGAHFNPAVTIAFSFTRHFPKSQIPAYLLAQYFGGFLAISLLSFLFPGSENFGATIPSVDILRAFTWEILLSFILMFVIISVATDTRAIGGIAGVAIGSTVLLCALFAGPYTGASMNPARSFAPNLFQGELNTLWIYTLGPIIGALIAAFTYEWIRCDDKNEDQQAAKGCC